MVRNVVRSNALNAAKVRTAKSPGRYADGNCLYLLVDPRGNRRWVQRLTVVGRRTDLGLGSWPLVSLAESRELAFANRKCARGGGDPRTERRRESIPTFAESAKRVIALNAPTWNHHKTAVQWRNSLATYALPHFGRCPVDQVTGEDILGALTPIWTAKPEMARRVKRRIGAVLKWAVAQGWRTDNPAGDTLSQVLPKTPRFRAHFKAIHYSEVPGALARVRESKASAATRLSLEFMVVTAVRGGEVRNMNWEEVDFYSATWTIPAKRMKANREHRVPLSELALAILSEAQVLRDSSGLVFPSLRSRPLSDMTHLKLLRTLCIDCVPHGFRSSFRDWAAECTDAPHAVMEAALAHVIGNSTEAAYFRSDLFERRRGLMDAWAAYLDQPTP